MKAGLRDVAQRLGPPGALQRAIEDPHLVHGVHVGIEEQLLQRRVLADEPADERELIQRLLDDPGLLGDLEDRPGVAGRDGVVNHPETV